MSKGKHSEAEMIAALKRVGAGRKTEYIPSCLLNALSVLVMLIFAGFG